MTIRITKQPDVYLTESELRRYRDEYRRAYAMYAGSPPSFEDFIRKQQQMRSELETDLAKPKETGKL